MVKAYLKFYKHYTLIQNTTRLNGLWFWLRRLPLVGRKLSPTFYGLDDLKLVLLVILKWLALPSFIIKKSFLVLLAWLFPFMIKVLQACGMKALLLDNSDKVFIKALRTAIASPDVFQWTLSLFLFACLMSQVNFIEASGKEAFEAVTFAKTFQLSGSDTLKKMNRIKLLLSSLAYLLPLAILGLRYHQLFVAVCLPIALRIVGINSSIFLVTHEWWTSWLARQQKKKTSWIGLNSLLVLSCFLILIYGTVIRTWHWSSLLTGVMIVISVLSFGLAKGRLIPHDFIRLITGYVWRREAAVLKMKQGKGQTNQGFSAAQKTSQQLEVTDESDLFKRFAGTQLLNHLLFKRYRPIFIKKLRRRLSIMLALLVVIVGSAAYLTWLKGMSTEQLTAAQASLILPPTVFSIMYFMSLSKESVAIYYLKCDQALLNYPFYRTKTAILQSFLARWQQAFLLNMPLTLALFANFFAILLLFGKGIPLSFYALVLFYGITVTFLFSFHDLFLYYIFQPYDQSGQNKNPAFKAIDGLFYFFCIQNFQISNAFKNSIAYVLSISILIVIYVITGLVLIRLRASKTFKLK
ncbi:MAG: hypothetical protein LBS41_02215 [Streptococcaceae bacterium]|jgi:hypothetical protein|nr:hypothetical protein [Streptococcaceae bacterium]